MNKNIPYYIAAAGFFILLKAGYTFAGNDNLIFLLSPTDKLVGLLTGSHSVYLTESGYFHSALNITVDKSCSGFNLWVLSFLVFSYLLLKYFEKPSGGGRVVTCRLTDGRDRYEKVNSRFFEIF
jgi:exosortase K